MEWYSDMPDTNFPLTEEEIYEQFDRVFKNEFETRTVQGSFHNVWTESSWFDLITGRSYNKGYHTQAILINSSGEKDMVWFWKYYKHGKVRYGYSFKKRELYPNILN